MRGHIKRVYIVLIAFFIATTFFSSCNIDKKGKVCILTYHCIENKISRSEYLFVSPERFDKQMEYLKQNHYTVIPYSQMDNSEGIEKPVVITFDDGYRDNYTYAYPILKKYHYKATIFLITGLIGRPFYLTKDEIRSMRDLISFQSHTVNHPNLRRLQKKEIERQLSESKTEVENITGEPVDALAYPLGEHNGTVDRIAKEYYKYTFTTRSGLYRPGSSHINIVRYSIEHDDNMKVFEQKVRGKLH